MAVVLVTGAAGRIGRALIDGFAGKHDLRLLDRHPSPELPGMLVGDINDGAVLDEVMVGVEVVVHLAGDPSVTANFDNVLRANIGGTYAVLEAAHRHGVGRVVLASSNRTVELASPLRRPPQDVPATQVIGPDTPPAPDSLYGAGKLATEAIAAYFSGALGLTTVSLRLGSVDVGTEPSVADKPRAWALWLSRRDLVGLFAAAIDAPLSGAVVVFACSANTRRWWDLEPTGRLLGYHPVDDSEKHLHSGHRAGPVPPAPTYGLPWGERLRALEPEQGQGFLVALGQSGFFLRTTGVRLAIDPFLTVYPDRLQPPLLAAADLPVDHVLVTHTHRDHLDGPGLEALAAARPEVGFVGPPTVVAALVERGIPFERITVLRPGEHLRVGDVDVVALKVRHRPTTPDAQGYVVRTPVGTLFHTGDAELDPCLLVARQHAPDLLLVPVNGRKGNMTAEEAALLAAQLDVPVAIPMHYGCLQPTEDLPERFLAELARVAPGTRPGLMAPGSIAQLPLPDQS